MSEYGKQVKKQMDTYLDNPDSIDEEVHDIQNARLGVEVRAALGAGVRKSFDKSQSAEERSNEAYDITQNLLDETFDSAALESNFEQRLDDEIQNLQPEWTEFKNNVNSINTGMGLIPENFPRIGNETDDTERLRRIISYAKSNNIDKVIISSDLEISSTVIVDKSYLTFYSDVQNDIMTSIKASDDFVGDSLIHVKAPGVGFNRIRFVGDNDSNLENGELIAIKYDFDMPDMDSYIVGCTIDKFKIGVWAKGRNLRVFHTLFGRTNFCIELFKHEDENATYGNDIRGIVIKDNKFHTVGRPNEFNPYRSVVLTVHDSTQNQNVIFSNNLIEQTAGIVFKGHYRGLTFSNNKGATVIAPWVMDLDNPLSLSGTRLAKITDNEFYGGNVSGENNFLDGQHFIKAHDLREIVIKDNVLNNFTKEAILCQNTITTEINNNTFRNTSYGLNHGQHSVILINETLGDQTYIESNHIISVNAKYFVEANNRSGRTVIVNNNGGVVGDVLVMIKTHQGQSDYFMNEYRFGYLNFGNSYIFADVSHSARIRLRIKQGSPPTSHTDGQVIGEIQN